MRERGQASHKGHLIRSQRAASQSEGRAHTGTFRPLLDFFRPSQLSTQDTAPGSSFLGCSSLLSTLSQKHILHVSSPQRDTKDSRTSASSSQVHKDRDILGTAMQPTQPWRQAALWTLHTRTWSYAGELCRDETQTRRGTEGSVLHLQLLWTVTALRVSSYYFVN